MEGQRRSAEAGGEGYYLRVEDQILLHVMEGADRAYGLTPLSAATRERPAQTEDSHFPSIYITLTAPESGERGPHPMGAVCTGTKTDNTGVSLEIAMWPEQQELGELLQHVPDVSDERYGIAARVEHNYCGMLQGIISAMLPRVIELSVHQKLDERVARTLRRQAVIVTAGALGGSAVTEIFSIPDVPFLRTLVPVGIATYGLWQIIGTAKMERTLRTLAIAQCADDSALRARSIGKAVHRAFCGICFDADIERRMQE